jgi:hypothetical protein
MPGVAITALTDDSDAVAVGSIGAVSLSRATGFNGSTYDRIRTLGGTSLNGLGQLSTSAGIPGASVVISILRPMNSSSTTRQTIITPTSGKRVRIISCRVTESAEQSVPICVYFGTGATQNTTKANIIGIYYSRGGVTASDGDNWPDGAGPVGAVDSIVSTVALASVSGNPEVVIHYREE